MLYNLIIYNNEKQLYPLNLAPLAYGNVRSCCNARTGADYEGVQLAPRHNSHLD